MKYSRITFRANKRLLFGFLPFFCSEGSSGSTCCVKRKYFPSKISETRREAVIRKDMECSSEAKTLSVLNAPNPTKTWVQCDNNDCKKWRRVTNEEAETITDDTKWFCSMNKDITCNNCAYPEEEFQAEEDLAKKFGIKYITSPLCDGTIVWAKVDGYCRWPAIISKDPDALQSSFQSIDGDTLCYHVEFLGKKHCHGVIRAPLVTEYVVEGKASTMSPKLPTDIQRILDLKKKSSKGPKKKLKPFSSLKCEYHGGSVQIAIEEANRLLKLPAAERVNSVVFRPVIKHKENPSHAAYEEKTETTEEEKDTKVCRTPTMSPQMASLHLKKCFSSPAMSDRCGKRKRYVEGSGSSASLVNISKEEKFTLDLQAYQRNEDAFEHDLKRYWDRMGQPLSVIPDWQGEPVKLFSVFSAVNDRGGYEQVCQTTGAWQRIYQEATNSNTSKKGMKAKIFYMKYLLPFQLYLQGKDYNEYIKLLHRTNNKTGQGVGSQTQSDCISAKRRRSMRDIKSKCLKKASDCGKSCHRRKNDNPKPKLQASDLFYDEDVGFSYILTDPPKSIKENLTNFSTEDYHTGNDWKEIEQMLQSIPAFHETDETTKNNKQDKTVEVVGSKMAVVFHEDDTPEYREKYEWQQGFQMTEANSEFDFSSASGGQRVPSMSKSESTSQPDADQVLLEMEAVQNEIGDIHEQLLML